MSDYVEMTFVALKPDAVQRGLSGEIISRFEDAGFKISAMKMVQPDEDILEEHYEEHVDKPFFDELKEYMTEGPVIGMVLEGVHAVDKVRDIIGDTDASEAHPSTIRGRWAQMSMDHADSTDTKYKNLVHASATQEEAEREIEIWFNETEIHDYRVSHEEHVR